MRRRTAAQEHGTRMRASGRSYRGGYRREEIRAKKKKSVWCECKEEPKAEDWVYYERTDGRHGWECPVCGGILQTG